MALSREEKRRKDELLYDLQDKFPNTVAGLLMFAQVVINALIIGNPNLNRVQADMLAFIFSGNKYRMVQAQRGQAKTTITAIYSVFKLIHAPHTRIVIVSQNSRRAKEIAGWVIKIMNGLDFLEFMRPDKYAGDKSSLTEGYDVHSHLKGKDKSPSVAAYSIEAGIQGARADIIIADDIESLQNSRTALGREILEDASKEFESVNQTGDIIYLGTPQSINSIYNNLPARGYEIRIWTGRYPNREELPTYGNFLSPMLLGDMENNPELQSGYGLDGTSGYPTCPEMFDDEALIEKEISQGTAKFQLQFMLNTRLSDKDRYPLRIEDLMFYSFGSETGLTMPVWSRSIPFNQAKWRGNRDTDKMFMAQPCFKEGVSQWSKWDRTLCFIDPAGGGKNGDETGVTILSTIGTYIFVHKCFGIKGGYDSTELMKIVDACKQFNCREVFVERNFGNGAYATIIKPLFEANWRVNLDDEFWASGQKEVRIIETLEPLFKAHRIVINTSVVDEDYESVQKYPAERRMQYSLFSQISNITLEKNSLAHDDRLDSLYAAVWQVVKMLDYDESSKRDAEAQEAELEWIAIQNDVSRRSEWFTGHSRDNMPIASLNCSDTMFS